MLSKIFGKTTKKEEFDIPEVKLNKKVSMKSAADLVIPVTHETPIDTPNRNGRSYPSRKKRNGRSYPSRKKRVEDLTSIEKHYYDQIKSLLKNTNKEAIRKSIERMTEKTEISIKELLVILDMF